MATNHLYGRAILSAFQGQIDVSTHDIRVMLVASAYGPSASHQYKSSVVDEIVSDGYQAGGTQLQNVSLSFNDGANQAVLDADDVSWVGLTATPRYAVIYDATAADEDNMPLIAYVDLEDDISAVSSDFALTWDASGIASFTAG